MIRTFLLAAAGAAAMAGAAAAAPPPPFVAVPVFTWAGFYGGVSGGYGWGNSTQTDPGIPAPPSKPPPPPQERPLGVGDGKFRMNGGFVGGGAGYNWQIGSWVLGLEGDYAWSDIKGSSPVCGLGTPLPHGCGTKIDSFGTFRGRVGYAFGPTGNWLLYGTGGLAVGDIHGWDALSPASGSKTLVGWSAGAGLEYMIAPNWTAKIEYIHADFGKSRLFNIVPLVPETVSAKVDLLRVGVNYKFSSW